MVLFTKQTSRSGKFIKEGEMDGTCSKNEKREKSMQNFSRIPVWNKNLLRYIDLDENEQQ
jgi:hypothetical protein